jgi:hypothetical protein
MNRADSRGQPERVQNSRILRNRFYIGYFTWDGVEYEGNHDRLIDPKVFQTVQAPDSCHHDRPGCTDVAPSSPRSKSSCPVDALPGWSS